MKTDAKARTLWDFLRVEREVYATEYALVPCSNDLRVVDHIVSLYNKGKCSTVCFSGGIAHTDDLLETGWDEPEATVFKHEAIEKGIPGKDIITETEATNTEENIRYGKRQIGEVDEVLLVQKPFSEKRVLATVKKQWDDVTPLVASSPLTYEEYPTQAITKDVLINLLVGEVQRLQRYPEKGYIANVPIPDSIQQAKEDLVDAGYDKHLIG